METNIRYQETENQNQNIQMRQQDIQLYQIMRSQSRPFIPFLFDKSFPADYIDWIKKKKVSFLKSIL